MIGSWLYSVPFELSAAAGVSLLSVLAAGIPFLRGLRVFLRARAATRRVTGEKLFRAHEGRSVEPIAQHMMGVLTRSLNDHSDQPIDFVRDATRQYVLNDYEVNYSRPLSMYSNILPPIGFIGTVIGMMVLFLSLHLSDETLQLSALSAALSSTIMALLAFATLETMRIRLYGRLMRCMNDVLSAAPRAPAAEAA